MTDLASPQPRPRTRRRPLRILGYLTFLLVLAEAGAWTFLLAGGHDTPLQAMEVLAAEPGADAVPRPGATLRRIEGLHPYLGFLPKDTGGGVPESVYMAWQQRFYEPDSPLYSSDPDDLVVGITGGSVAAQFARFGGADHLAELLAQSERFRGRRARFLVLAYGGVKQPQQLMGLNYLLALGGRLDLLLNLDGFNEVALHEHDNQRQGVAPVYPRAWLPRVGGGAVLQLVAQQRVLKDRRRAELARLQDSWLRASGLRRAAWVLEDRDLGAQLAGVEQQLRDFEPASVADLPNLGPAVAAEDAAGRLVQLVDIWRRSSLQMHNLCAANGIEYTHFLQPNQYVPDSKVLSAEERAMAWRPDDGYAPYAPAGYARLRVAGEDLLREGVRFHDLTGIYRDVAETVYADDCCHVNGLGNQLLAEAIREALVSWGD